METIKWKQIDGWPDYEVSRDGKVRKVSTGSILAPRNVQFYLDNHPGAPDNLKSHVLGGHAPQLARTKSEP